jgi:hypothetical protein
VETKVSTRQKMETILRERGKKRRTIPPTIQLIIMLVPDFFDLLNTVDEYHASMPLSGKDVGRGIEDLGGNCADFCHAATKGDL